MGLSNYLPNSRISQSGVCTSSTRPASPYEGQIIYETDTNRVLVWDNAAWVMIADTDQPPGLQLVKTQTIGTSVTSVSVTDAFNSDFDNYVITISNVAVSGNGILSFNFEDSSGNIVNGANYVMTGFYQLHGFGSTEYSVSNTTGWEAFSVTTTSTNHGAMQIYGPYLAKYTSGLHEAMGNDYRRSYGLLHRLETSYTRFRLGSNTMTGGTIRVYGYRNS